MLVEDAMTRPVVTVDVDVTLREAVELMLDHRVGSVIVEEDGNPAGIVTETDVLTATHRTGGPLSDIPLEDAASRPLISVAPGATVRSAVDRMREERVKKLGVVDGIDLVGIITQEDVVDNHPLLIREAIHHEERRQEWEE